jgi:diguanylate cyclase (GGDEF)-like protein
MPRPLEDRKGAAKQKKRKDAPGKEPAIGDQTLALPDTILDSPRLKRDHPGLVVIQGAELGREYRLRRTELILGRDEKAPIRLLDEKVSRRHARLELFWDPAHKLQKVMVRDLGSTNGTTVNGEPVDRAELREGDKIRLGDTVLKFVLHDDLDARFHREIRARIAYDQLTGLLTKESLCLAMEQEIRRCLKFKLPLAVIMMDLDLFKAVNDRFGHLMGSFVLSQVGILLREGFRTTDVSARYGGEEFLAYLSEATAAEARRAAERIRLAVEEHPFTRVDENGKATTVRITLSGGIAELRRNGDTLESLIAAADAALYRAKDSGRNRICLA